MTQQWWTDVKVVHCINCGLLPRGIVSKGKRIQSLTWSERLKNIYTREQPNQIAWNTATASLNKTVKQLAYLKKINNNNNVVLSTENKLICGFKICCVFFFVNPFLQIKALFTDLVVQMWWHGNVGTQKKGNYRIVLHFEDLIRFFQCCYSDGDSIVFKKKQIVTKSVTTLAVLYKGRVWQVFQSWRGLWPRFVWSP